MIYKIVLTNQKKINISEEEYLKVKEALTKGKDKFLEIHGILINPSYIIQIERDFEMEIEEEKRKFSTLSSFSKDFSEGKFGECPSKIRENIQELLAKIQQKSFNE